MTRTFFAPLMIEAMLLDISFVVGELIEGNVLIEMVVDVG